MTRAKALLVTAIVVAIVAGLIMLTTFQGYEQRCPRLPIYDGAQARCNEEQGAAVVGLVLLTGVIEGVIGIVHLATRKGAPTPTPRTCPGCGRLVPVGHLFCSSCGYSFRGSASPER